MSKNDKKKNKGSLKGNVDTKKREHVDVQKKNINSHNSNDHHHSSDNNVILEIKREDLLNTIISIRKLQHKMRHIKKCHK